VPLQVDANTAYSLGDAKHLAELDMFSCCYRQPLPEDQCSLTRSCEGGADRYLPGRVDHFGAGAEDAIQLGAVRVINVSRGGSGVTWRRGDPRRVRQKQDPGVDGGDAGDGAGGGRGTVAMGAMANSPARRHVSLVRGITNRISPNRLCLVEGSCVSRRDGAGVEVDEEFLKAITSSKTTVRRNGKQQRAKRSQNSPQDRARA